MIEKVELDYKGRKVKGRKIKVSSVIPTGIHKVWDKIQDVETLRFIARPYAYFNPLGEIPSEWKEGDTYVFRTLMHRLIPIGKHTIRIAKMDRGKGEIVSNEFDMIVRLWNHEIRMKESSNGNTDYTDMVHIYAGIFTPLVAWWSIRFYKHLQRKWKIIAVKL